MNKTDHKGIRIQTVRLGVDGTGSALSTHDSVFIM
jgi:hypothetical protein